MNASLSPECDVEPTRPVVAILAGGLGTRLHPVSTSIPKSLIPVAGEPFLAHQLRFLSRQGLCDIVLCLGHFGEQIARFAGDGSCFGCRIRYSWDGPRPLGTGGAIRQALPLLGAQFCVLYGDSYLTAPLFPAWNAFATLGKPSLMTILRNGGRWDTSNVAAANGEILRYNKRAPDEAMEHIDYGFGIFRAEVFNAWPAEFAFDLSDVQQELAAAGVLAAFEVMERFYEIGSMQGLQDTDRFLSSLLAEPGGAAPKLPQPECAEKFLMGVPV